MCHPHLPCSSLTTAALNVIQCMRTDRGVKGLADRLLALMEMNVCVCGGALKGKECGSQAEGQHAVQVTMCAQRHQ